MISGGVREDGYAGCRFSLRRFLPPSVRKKNGIPCHVKLPGKEQAIRDLREQGVTISEIARIFKVNRATVSLLIKEYLNAGGE